MKVIYVRSHTASSLLIRTGTWSPWSHVMVDMGDGTVIDATFTHGGVKRRDKAEALATCSRIEVVDYKLPNEQAAIDFLIAQLDKEYDWTALLGFVFRTDWSEPTKWFCSELIEAAMVAGGYIRFRADVNRITPRDSWIVIQ